MWQNGPIMYVSQKLAHCSKGASSHNEYMAMSECSRSVIWLRQLFSELELSDINDKGRTHLEGIDKAPFINGITSNPTVIFGDNNAANKLAMDNAISTGNQYIYLPYHCIKEYYSEGFVDIQRKKSKYNLSDLFTKNTGVGEIKTLLPSLCGYAKLDISL